MSSRQSMEFDDELDVPGKFPDFGAIFMSNNATKKECFRRRLLGLPMGQAHFVMQVKAGMILFLFEFEKRELHGVFRACSDGDLNIVPRAFSSTGKQFPAQVKFIPIWNCSPLSENEFRDAIRENYFSAYKFNFGLSERQVQRLLLLFSSRKLTDDAHRREFIQSKVARPISDFRNNARSTVDAGSFGTVHIVKDEQNAGGSFGPVITSEFLGDSISNCGREIDDGRFSSPIVRNGSKVERLHLSNELFQDHLGKVGRLVYDDQFRTGDKVKDEDSMSIERRCIGITNNPHPDDVRYAMRFQPRNLPEDHGFLQSNSHLYSMKPILQANSLVHDQSRESPPMHQLVDERSSNLPFPTSYGDTVPMPTSMVGYPGYSFRTSERGTFDARFMMSNDRGGECNEDMCCEPQENSGLLKPNPALDPMSPTVEAGLFADDLRRQPPLACRTVEPQDVDPYFPTPVVEMPTTSGFHTNYGDAVVTRSFVYEKDLQSLPNGCSSSSWISDSGQESPLPFNSIFPSLENRSFSSFRDPEGTCLENVARNFSWNERPNADASACSFNLNKPPSSTMDNTYILSAKLADYKMSQHENAAASHAYVPMLKEVGGTRSMNHNNSSSSPDIRQNFKTMHPDDKKRRVSVFSRIVMPPEVQEQEEYKTISSVDEVLAMLHQNRHQWLTVNSSKPLTEMHEEVASIRSKKQIVFNSKSSKISKVLKDQSLQTSKEKGQFAQTSKENGQFAQTSKENGQFTNTSKEKDQLPHISKEINTNDISAGESNNAPKAGEIPFIDFKRRSKVPRPTSLDDGNSNDHDESAITTASSCGQQRKRKLIRPKFHETESGENTRDHDKNDQDAESLDGWHKLRKLIRPRFDEIKLSGDVMVKGKVSEHKITDPVLHIGEEGNPDTEIGLICEGQDKVGECVFVGNADGKERLDGAGVCNLAFQVPYENESNAEESPCFKHSEVDGLPVQCRNSKHLVLQEFSESRGEEAETKMKDCGLDHDEISGKLYPNVETVGRICPISGNKAIDSVMTTPTDDNPESERASNSIGNGECSEPLLFFV